MWHKYSDMTVTRVDAEEVWKVSRGGSSQASAYSLIYHRLDMLGAEERHGGGGGAHAAAALSAMIPPHLRREVEEDNRKLDEEVASWTRSQKVSQRTAMCDAQLRIRNKNKNKK